MSMYGTFLDITAALDTIEEEEEGYKSEVRCKVNNVFYYFNLSYFSCTQLTICVVFIRVLSVCTYVYMV